MALAVRREPVVTAVFRYNHLAHVYGPTDNTREFDLRSVAYLIIDGYEDRTALISFIHNGVFEELGQFYSSGQHGSGMYALNEAGVLEPRILSFSFLGTRAPGQLHHLKAAPIPGGDMTRNYLAIHCGRTQGRPNRSPIPANAPWALLRRQTPETLGDQRRYEDLLAWLRTRPVLPPAEDRRLREVPSRL